jgi:hypothetical protein
MKKILCALLLGASALPFSARAQQFCNANGNVAIFSNYDGGVLKINVDQNIPNLRIGIVSYEDDSVIISGAFAGNVTKVVYAGYYNSNNVNCPPDIAVKGVYGVSSSIVTIVAMPPATYTNANGYSSIICNYTCSTTTNQGGCNTPDQIVAYFNTQFSSTNTDVLFHYTQYNCWTGNTIYNISAGGNCCAMPITTGQAEQNMLQSIQLYPNPASGNVTVATNMLSAGNYTIEVLNLVGEVVYTEHFVSNGTINRGLHLGELGKGVYGVRISGSEGSVLKKLVIE